jgi:hypothetical protein
MLSLYAIDGRAELVQANAPFQPDKVDEIAVKNMLDTG